MAASVGDSRAVLATLTVQTPTERKVDTYRNPNKYKRQISGMAKGLDAVQLTVDQKPNHEEEMERILQCGGRVSRLADAMGNRVGPYRVWKKNGSQPGIAMSRSIGDKMASTLGVIATPVVQDFEWALGSDQFVVVGSDGLWYRLLRDVMSNDEVVQFVEKFRKQCASSSQHREGPITVSNTLIAELLCEEARYRWFGVVEEEDVMVDDISCIVVQLECPGILTKPATGVRISRMVNVSVMLEESREEEEHVEMADPRRNSISLVDEDRLFVRNIVRRDLVRGSTIEDSESTEM